MNKTILGFIALLGLASVASAANPYMGFSAGYLLDGKDPLFCTRLGFELARQEKLTHSVEAEIGITRSTDYGITLDVVPIMANYRLGIELAPKLSLDIGGGLGMTWNRLKYYGSSSDVAFAYQLFTGLNFSVNEKTSLCAGVRYIDIGEATLSGITAELGDDVSLELGVKFKF